MGQWGIRALSHTQKSNSKFNVSLRYGSIQHQRLLQCSGESRSNIIPEQYYPGAIWTTSDSLGQTPEQCWNCRWDFHTPLLSYKKVEIKLFRDSGVSRIPGFRKMVTPANVPEECLRQISRKSVSGKCPGIVSPANVPEWCLRQMSRNGVFPELSIQWLFRTYRNQARHICTYVAWAHATTTYDQIYC